MDTSPDGIGGLLARKGEQRPANCPEHGPYTAVNILRNVWTGCKSCEDARTYQIRWGVSDVTPCDTLTFERSMERDETGGAPLTPQEAEKRRRP